MGSVHETIRSACAERGAALLGVLNVTPDSFFDGGLYTDAVAAKTRIDALLAEGADLIEIGPESSRPGSEPILPEEQLRRAVPALEYALERGAIVSIDTTSPKVAEETLRRGAHMLNDVSCLAQPELAAVAAAFSVPFVIMHSRGSMSRERFSEYPDQGYGDVVFDVSLEWTRARESAISMGVSAQNVWFDPGLGFHKNAQQSFDILSRLDEFLGLSEFTVIGASRKSFLGTLDGAGPARRLGGSIAAALEARRHGAHVIRVHDVFETRQALLLTSRVSRPGERQAHA
jgi:dihydropteroate synthase